MEYSLSAPYCTAVVQNLSLLCAAMGCRVWLAGPVFYSSQEHSTLVEAIRESAVKLQNSSIEDLEKVKVGCRSKQESAVDPLHQFWAHQERYMGQGPDRHAAEH